MIEFHDMDRTGEIIVTLANEEKHFDYDRFNLSFDSSDREILDAIAPVLLEDEGFDINDADETFTVKRVQDSQNIYVFPKSTAGRVL